MTTAPDIAAVVQKTTQLVVQQTIDIPRILVVPKGEVTTGFDRFTLDCSNIHYQPGRISAMGCAHRTDCGVTGRPLCG